MTPTPPMSSEGNLLVLNAGSSSLKFAVFRQGSMERLLTGMVERLGEAGSTMKSTARGGEEETLSLRDHADPRHILDVLTDQLARQLGTLELLAVGHRVVHGGSRYLEPQAVDEEMLRELRAIRPLDPDHLPHEIAFMKGISSILPAIPQVACFDTAFHSTLPRVARIVPIPRRFEAKGIRRYGFHGISYSYLTQELGRLGSGAARGRLILAHLGGGASLAAVLEGNSIDSTMGFTPSSGLVMGTRPGDLDPGLFSYLTTQERMDARQFDRMINHESGLLGISGTSADMRDLLAAEATDENAAEAVALFCYQVKKGIGAYAAALGGVDGLVFSGGVGENSATIRQRICEGLSFLGIELDETENQSHAPLISRRTAPVKVRVIPTDEECMIATAASRLLGTHSTTRST